ncbi:MAG: M24 family metallopeptidase [Pseudomonadota bacterium]
MTHRDKLKKLRVLMKKEHIDAYLLTNSDPHQNEYIPEHWARNKYLTGFTAPYCNIIITQKSSKLWINAMETIRAKYELKGSPFTYETLLVVAPGFNSEINWTNKEFGKDFVLGIDAQTLTINQMDALKNTTSSMPGITIKQLNTDLVTEIWEQRPPLSTSTLMFRDERFEDLSADDKIMSVQKILKEKNIDLHVVLNLESIARVMNVRGTDLPYEPMAVSCLIIGKNNVSWFLNRKRLPKGYKKYLPKNTSLLDYKDFWKKLKVLSKNKVVLVAPNETSQSTLNNMATSAKIIKDVSPITRIKALKTPFEIKNIANACVKDCSALIKAIFWIKNEVKKHPVNELELVQKIIKLKKEQKHFFSLSFIVIAAYNENAADTHYHPTERSNKKIKNKGLVLVDTGGQYLDGTTDTTRTVTVGVVPKEIKENYTRVLKGHVNIAGAIFPQGTRAYNIDVLARKFLWDKGLDYPHKTGHGIGYYGCVHETSGVGIGPLMATVLEEGMVMSNEPGYYKEGRYGIRIENMVYVAKDKKTNYLCFKQLTMCPYEKELIVKKMLTAEEIKWINDYHRTVYKNLAPNIGNGKLLAWLKKACAPM